MKILSGKRQKEIAPEELAELMRGCFPVHIDVGTGSGRMMLKLSGLNPGGFYIGMDPSAASMQENSVKAAKRARKTGQDNLLFVVGAIEAAPEALAGIADTVSVILPWGSLRDGIVKADHPVMSGLRALGKAGTALELLVGYEEHIEPRVMETRCLPALSRQHFSALAPAYRDAGIEIRGIKAVSNGELKAVESDWAKKLAYGQQRVMYRLDCVYV